MIIDNLKLIKSISDHREYKLIKLKENEIEILLISDPQTDTSSAAVNVNIGQLSDPTDRQGLAHFLEHMLFLGTSKYPQACEFDQYLSKNSGYSNAYTSLEETNYYFNCLNDAFDEGLDRFAQFFIEPLFNEEFVEKELHAVHSEHIKNLQQDSWREDYFLRYTSLQNSYFNKFGSGNLNTLNFPTIRQDLIDFYNKYYSSNLMKVVVLSNKNLIELECLSSNLFSQIPNKNQPLPNFDSQPFDKSNMSKIYKIVPCKQENRIKFIWILEENYEKKYKSNPLCYLSYLIGHEGQNSLLSALIKENYAESLFCGFQHISIFSTFYIEISLTNTGFQQLNEVISYVFSYIQLLKEKGTQKWIYEENQSIKILKFQYKEAEEPIDYTYLLASKMQTCDHQDILRYDAVLEEFQEDLIDQTIKNLTVENLRINLISPSFEQQCKLQDPIYQIKYQVEDINSEIRRQFRNPKTEYLKKMDLPPKNHFIPKNFDLPQCENPEKAINCIENTPHLEFWYKENCPFKIPKICLLIRIHNKMFEGLKNQLLGELYVDLLNENCRELIYQGEMACIETIISFQNEINIILEGFSDTIYYYINELFDQIANFKIKSLNKELFLTQKEKLIKQYKNFFLQNPYEQGKNYCEYFLNKNAFSPEELYKGSQDITIEEMIGFCEKLNGNYKIQAFLGGNVNKKSAFDINQLIKKHFLKDNQKIFAVNKYTFDIPGKQRIILKKNLQKNEENSYICSIYQLGSMKNIKNRIFMELLDKLLEEPFYKNLRTYEQLGYIVFCSNFEVQNIGYFKFIIQSNVQCPEYLSSRIQNFINEQREVIKNYEESQFSDLKKSVECMLKQKDSTIYQETKKYFNEVIKQSYNFDLNSQMIESLKNIEIQEFIEFFESTFGERWKNVQIQLICQRHQENNDLLEKFVSPYVDSKYFNDINEFKQNCKAYTFDN